MARPASYQRLTNLDLKSSTDLRLDSTDSDDSTDTSTFRTTDGDVVLSIFTKYLRSIVLISLFLAFGLGMYALGLSQRPSARGCFDEITYHSPIADHIDVSYYEKPYDIPLFTNSVYVREPGPEVDEAWFELSYRPGGMISISESELLDAGYTTQAARLHFQSDGGDGGYLGGIEVFHLLHCVNFLRQASYFNVDYYKAQAAFLKTHPKSSLPGNPFSDPDAMVRPHLNHCIEALRQALMCRASAEVYAHKHVRNFSRILPAFKRPTKCANFESIREETVRRQLTHGISDEPLEGEYVFDEPSPMDYLAGKVSGWTNDGKYVGTRATGAK